MAVDSGDGAYRKESLGPVPHEGAIYVVAGSSSEVRIATLNHPAHHIGLLELGSLGPRRERQHAAARFLNSAGNVTDTATLPLTAQVANLDSGSCWENVFTAAKVNSADKIVAHQ